MSEQHTEHMILQTLPLIGWTIARWEGSWPNDQIIDLINHWVHQTVEMRLEMVTAQWCYRVMLDHTRCQHQGQNNTAMFNWIIIWLLSRHMWLKTTDEQLSTVNHAHYQSIRYPSPNSPNHAPCLSIERNKDSFGHASCKLKQMMAAKSGQFNNELENKVQLLIFNVFTKLCLLNLFFIIHP